MESMLQKEERVKQRDRWACKRCGKKFEDLVLCKFDPTADTDDCYITLCKSCVEWAGDNFEEAKQLCTKLLQRNKIVLVGDCHGNFEKLDAILTAERPFDFFLSVGDVGSLNDVTPQNLSLIEKWHNGYFVRGNHDNVEFFTPLEIVQAVNGIQVAALNGMLKSRTFLKEQVNNVSFREVMYLSHLKDVDILVTHQPPTGLFDGMGEAVLEELLNYLVTNIYISGHVHRYKFKFHLRTFVISLPMIHKGYVVAYFQGRDLRNIEIVLKKGKKFIRV